MKIENQAMMFALLCKYTVLAHGEEGRAAIQEGMKQYGRERGARMAERALANGDPVALWTDQAYGEWKPDYPGQMEFGNVRTEPTLVTYISKCAWCEAWKRHDILEYGREYCVNVDAAVYEGFWSVLKDDAGRGGNDGDAAAEEESAAWPVCTPLTTPMSWGGDRCDFDWGAPLSEEDLRKIADKKAELGTGAMRDFDFHTAHIYYTVTDAIKRRFPEDADSIIGKACADYRELFGQADLDRIFDFADEKF